ncbi:MAG: xanthan lyase, partial [Muribaculaceae bacterium]|nr:xanthan lyase [Muribaculaceae bacterium]
IHSYRIIAENACGRSFPAEILAACDLGNNRRWVTIVNVFTRVGAPERLNGGALYDGFDFGNDAGVPYIRDISYTGMQNEYRRDAAFITNDAPGFGASRATHEGRPVAGNSFDNVYTHGRAIAAAGHSFISSGSEAFMADTVTFAPVVDLILGKQKETLPGRGATGSRHKTFPEAMQHRLTSLAANGAAIMVSGSYLASDQWCNERATSGDRLFATTMLGYQWRASRATVSGEVKEVRSAFPQFHNRTYGFLTTPSDESYAVESADAIAPSDSRGAVIMRYCENGLPAATAFDGGNYRTVAMGFPFEVIINEHSRNALMKQILDFLTSTNR